MTLGNLDIDRNIYTVEGAICYHERKRQLTGGEERTGFPEMEKLLEQGRKGACEKGGRCLPSCTGTSLLSFWATGSNVTSRLKPAKECLASEMLHCNSPTSPCTARRRGSPRCRPAFSQPTDLKEKPVFQGEVQGTTRQCLGHRSKTKYD